MRAILIVGMKRNFISMYIVLLWFIIVVWIIFALIGVLFITEAHEHLYDLIPDFEYIIFIFSVLILLSHSGKLAREYLCNTKTEEKSFLAVFVPLIIAICIFVFEFFIRRYL